MRLIDADALEKRLDNEKWMDNFDRDFIVDVALDEAPTVDAVTVVRCCDCKYGEFDLIDQGYPEPPACEGMLCHKHNTKMDFTDFCSYGELKE